MKYLDNLLFNTDSYKTSHNKQYPPGTNAMFSYIEARGMDEKFSEGKGNVNGAHNKILFFGLQYILMEYLTKQITHEMVNDADAFFKQHGTPFPSEQFHYIVDEYDGYMPIKIRALKEGTVIPLSTPMVTVECHDEKCFSVASYFESLLLRVWYPTNVATVSWRIKKIIRQFMIDTADDLSSLPFTLHDFGARGVSSAESAAVGGMSHLVNFMGSDTVLGVRAAHEYYDEPMSAYSIPAAEHSTITSWGKEREVDAYRNMIKQFGSGIFAVVSDSYNIFNAVENIWGKELKMEVIRAHGTLVIRPDSGDPVEVVTKIAQLLDKTFCSTENKRGYKVLNHVRIIQGDGIEENMIYNILLSLKKNGFSAENVAFGMGGALLQGTNRDTFKFAMKCSAVRVGEQWGDVFKDPITDSGKKSKKGRIGTFESRLTHEIACFRTDQHIDSEFVDLMETVYELVDKKPKIRHQTMQEIRQHSGTWGDI